MKFTGLSASHDTGQYGRPRVERAWGQGSDRPHLHNKKQESVIRTIEKLQGKLALIASWENVELDKKDLDYMRELKRKIDMCRNQLRNKGALLTQHEEEKI